MSGRPLVLVGLLKKTNATSRHCREGKKMNKIPQSECNGTTHSACKSRFEKEGGKTRCCYCVPHEDCDFNQPQTSSTPSGEEWEKEFDFLFYKNVNGVWISRSAENYGSERPQIGRAELLQFIRRQIEQARQAPMGISEWSEYGKRYGYWDWFESIVLKEERDLIIGMLERMRLTRGEGESGKFKLANVEYNKALD